jgi:hypothetical protein
MTTSPLEIAMSTDLANIAAAPRAELLARWITNFKTPPPKGLSRRLLAYALCYHVQEQALGGLTATAKRTLTRASMPKSPARIHGNPPKQRRTAASGTRLVRTWHGQTHTVEVLNNSYHYRGKSYRSLSEIARLITGTRWSGPRFFGL